MYPSNQLDHFLLYGERHASQHLFLSHVSASDLLRAGLRRLEERRRAAFSANTDGNLSKEWMTLTSICSYTRMGLDTLVRSLSENTLVHPADIDYLVNRYHESDTLLRTIQRKIFKYWVIRLIVYFLIFFGMLFLPNMASVEQPSSHFYEITKNIFSVVCGLVLCQFVDVLMREKVQNASEVEKGALFIGRMISHLEERLRVSHLIEEPERAPRHRHQL